MDSYWGMTRMRSHVPRWCMCLYYPHEVTLESGPTGIVRGCKLRGAAGEGGGGGPLGLALP